MKKTRNKEGGHSLNGFIALCQSRSLFGCSVVQTKRGILRYPASVLAPGSALGLLPSIALSSAQADPILAEHEGHAPEKSTMLRVVHILDLVSYAIVTRNFLRRTPLFEYDARKTGLPALTRRSKNFGSRPSSIGRF